MDETPVLGLFIGVTDTLVEADIHELCTTDGDGLGCMKEVGLLNTGGLGSLVMAVDEHQGRVQAWPIHWMTLVVQNA